MIKTFRHKGLENYFLTGNKKGIQSSHSDKLSRILDKLDVAITKIDMNLPGYFLHELKENEKGTWAVSVSGNWRITFKFENGNAYSVDFIDYH